MHMLHIFCILIMRISRVILPQAVHKLGLANFLVAFKDMHAPWVPTADELPSRFDYYAAAWDFDILLQHNGHKEITILLAIVRKLVHHPVVRHALSKIMGMTTDAFKDYSNTGFVFRAGKPRDLGNYSYTLLFQFLHRMAKHYKLTHVSSKFDTLAMIYPSLSRTQRPSQHSISMKGDVLEVMLADCRYTGRSVPDQLRLERQEFHDTIVEYEAIMERVYCRLCQRPKPTLKRMPYPDLLMKIFTLANALVLEADPAKQQALKHQYKAAVASARNSVGEMAP